MTGEEVGVEVGLDDPLDAQTLGGRVVEVATDVTLRIDHDEQGPVVASPTR